MSDFDQTARAVVTAAPEPLLGWLAAQAGLTLAFHQWYQDRTLARAGGPERVADQVAVLHDPADAARPWLLVLECQTQPDAAKLDVLHEEGVLFLTRARWGPERQGRFDVLTAIIHLTGVAPEGRAVRSPLGFGLHHKPVVWDIAAEDAAEMLEGVAAGQRAWAFLFWLPLMKRGGEEIIARRWREVVEAAVPERGRRAELLEAARMFAELARNILTWEPVLEGWDVGESEVANKWRAEAAARASLKTKRQDTLALLDIKFPNAAGGDVRQVIEQQPSIDLLDDWFRSLARAATYDDFLAVLRR